MNCTTTSARPWLGVFTTLVTWLLGGCVATQYTEIPSDARPPKVMGGLAVAPCERKEAAQAATAATADSRPQIPPPEGCLVPVRARDFLAASSIAVDAGEVYRIEIPPGQFWFDLDRRSSPPRGDNGSDAMNAFEALKRHQRLPWFALLVTTARCEQNLNDRPFPETCHEAPGASAQHLAAESSNVTITAKGRLAFYVNDAVAPLFKDWFYENNRGQVWVWVRKAKKGVP